MVSAVTPLWKTRCMESISFFTLFNTFFSLFSHFFNTFFSTQRQTRKCHTKFQGKQKQDVTWGNKTVRHKHVSQKSQKLWDPISWTSQPNLAKFLSPNSADLGTMSQEIFCRFLECIYLSYSESV